MMEEEKVAQALFDHFGEEEFGTRDIPQDIMDKLAELMEISETGHARRSKVGRCLTALDDEDYILESGRKVRMYVRKPDTPRSPRSFQLLSLGKPLDKNATFEIPGTEITYEVVLVGSEESWAALCPDLYGCFSQGDTEAEALENVREAIVGWLKFKAIDAEKHKQKWLDEYREAGFPAKTATVTIPRIKANASWVKSNPSIH